MLTVTKEFTWDCAHMLEGHAGLCQNVHGHTYKMQIEVTHPGIQIVGGASDGMVVDFKDLKNIVKGSLVDKLDHAFVANENGHHKEQIVANTLKSIGNKLFFMQSRPTAENMALEFGNIIKHEIFNSGLPLDLVSLTIWETATSFATVKY